MFQIQLAVTTQPLNSPLTYLFQIFLPVLPYAIIGLVVIAGLAFVKNRLTGSSRSSDIDALPDVAINKKFISFAELDFYRVLQQVVGDHGLILAQVSLRQLLYFPGNNQTNPGRQIWINKIAQRCVDFVVVDPKSLRPRFIIELNDSSHQREDRMTRDEEVRAILKKAGLPILPVPVSKSYDRSQLAKAIASLVPVI